MGGIGSNLGEGWGSAINQDKRLKQEQNQWSTQANPYTQHYWTAVNNWGMGNDKLVADRSADTLMAEDLTRKRAISGSPLVKSAQQQVSDMMAGKYFDQDFNNIWGGTSDKLRKTYQDITLPSIDTRFSLAGRTGSGAASTAYGKASEGLGTSLADLASNIYNTERGKQMLATQMAPGLAAEDYKDLGALNAVGANREAYDQRLIDAKSNKLKTWGGMIQPGLGLGGTGSTSMITSGGGGGGNPLAQLLGLYMQNPQMWNNMVGGAGNSISNWWNNYDSNTGGYTGNLGGSDGNYGGQYDWNTGEGSFGGME